MSLRRAGYFTATCLCGGIAHTLYAAGRPIVGTIALAIGFILLMETFE